LFSGLFFVFVPFLCVLCWLYNWWLCWSLHINEYVLNDDDDDDDDDYYYYYYYYYYY
jgi:hypothetical protein